MHRRVPSSSVFRTQAQQFVAALISWSPFVDERSHKQLPFPPLFQGGLRRSTLAWTPTCCDGLRGA